VNKHLAPLLILASVCLWQLAVTSSGQEAREPGAAAAGAKVAGVKLTIEAVERRFAADKGMRIKTRWTNLTRDPVVLTCPGDGSGWGWRTPLVGWSALPVAETEAKHPIKVPQLSGGRCGNINAIGAADVLRLAAGQSHVIEGWAEFPRLEAGRYRVVFYYENRPLLAPKGVPLGQHEPAALKAIRGSRACLLRSNELIVEVLPAAPR
jgi:hypothetical protein